MFAFHVEVWCLTSEDQTRELQGGGLWSSRGWQSIGVWGDKPGCTNVQAVTLASAPTLQEAKPWNTGKTGLFPSLSQSILCSNQCERLARDSTAGLNSCTGVLGRGFQWCRKACTSFREQTTLLIRTAYETCKKKPKFLCPSSILCVPVVWTALLLFNSDNYSGKWSKALLGLLLLCWPGSILIFPPLMKYARLGWE